MATTNFSTDFFNEGTTNEQNITYANISNGQIVVRSTEDDPKAKGRINKLGNQVYERFFKSVTGVITGISVEENKFGEVDLRIKMLASEGTIGVLTIKLDSSYGRSFLEQIFNADLRKSITFTPWSKITDDDKKITKLYLNHGRSPINRQLPEGTPEIKWVETKKGNIMDSVSKIAHDEFLEQKLNDLIKDNDLVWDNKLSSVNLGDLVDTTPLTEAEKAELKDIKKENKKSAKEEYGKVMKYSNTIPESGSMDEFFDSI